MKIKSIGLLGLVLASGCALNRTPEKKQSCNAPSPPIVYKDVSVPTYNNLEAIEYPKLTVIPKEEEPFLYPIPDF